MRTRTNVGIEVTSEEVRAVSLSLTEDKAILTSVFHADLPHGAVSRGRINNPAAVATALQPWLRELGPSAGVQVSIGIPSGATVLRLVEIPPAPIQELPTIVAGEVEYYKIVSGAGAHGFVRLGSGKASPDEPNTVLIAAAARPVIASAGDLSERIGLHISALEPTQFGRLRLAMASLGAKATAGIVIIGHQSTDVAFIHDGQLWFYRRIDKGADDLCSATKGKLHTPAVQGLVAELKHALSYFEREFEQFSALEALDILYSEPNLAGIDAILAKELSIYTRLIQPGEMVTVLSQCLPSMADEGQYRFAGAIGLALRGTLRLDASIPEIDLYAGERKEVTRQAERRTLTASFAVAAAALIFGMFGMWMYGRRIGETKAATAEAVARVQAFSSDAYVTEQTRTRDVALYHQLRKSGLPITGLMDTIADSLSSGTGIRSVQVNDRFDVVIEGEATDVSGMLATVKNLQGQPMLQGTKLESFSGSGKTLQSGMLFTVRAKAVAIDQVAPSPQVHVETAQEAMNNATGTN